MEVDPEGHLVDLDESVFTALLAARWVDILTREIRLIPTVKGSDRCVFEEIYLLVTSNTAVDVKN